MGSGVWCPRMQMQQGQPGWLLGHAFGRIPVVADPSALLLPLLVYFITGGEWAHFAALLLPLVVAIVLHELGHALAALWCKARNVAVVLTALGGICLFSQTLSPRQQLLVTIAGPTVNILLFGLGLAVFFLVPEMPEKAELVLRFHLWCNGILALFNLLPIYPLDGGQIVYFLQRILGLQDRRARRSTFVITVACAALVALAAFKFEFHFIGFLTIFLVWQAYNHLERR